MMLKAIALLVIAPAAWAAMPAAAQSSGVTALVEANKALTAKLDAATKEDGPSLRNGDAALVSRAFDTAAVRALPEDLSIAEVCTALGQSIVSYANYAGRAAGGDGAAADQYLLTNLQEEMARGLAAGNLCIARTYRATIPVVQAMPADRVANIKGALGQMRDGAVQTVDGTFDFMPRMTPANAMMVVDAVNEQIEAMAVSLPPAARKQLGQTIRGHIAAAPAAVRGKMTAVAAAFDRTECNIICRSTTDE